MIELHQGHLYRLVYKLQSGNGQWYKYEAYMSFLGRTKTPMYGAPEGNFNLRPIAGTQTLRLDHILEAEDLGSTHGRDDPRHRAKKSLGRIPKEDS